MRREFIKFGNRPFCCLINDQRDVDRASSEKEKSEQEKLNFLCLTIVFTISSRYKNNLNEENSHGEKKKSRIGKTKEMVRIKQHPVK